MSWSAELGLITCCNSVVMRLRHIDSMYILALYTVNYILEYSIIYHTLPIIRLSITHPHTIGVMISRHVAVLTPCGFFVSILVIGEFPIPNSICAHLYMFLHSLVHAHAHPCPSVLVPGTPHSFTPIPYLVTPI
jgi:hypothetical protein